MMMKSRYWGKLTLIQFGTHKVIEKLSQEKVSQEEALEMFKWKVERDHEIKVLGEVNVELESGTKKPREKLSHEEDSEEETLEEFNLTLDNVLEKLSQEKIHFGWDWDSPGIGVDWQDDPLHETEDFFVGLDQSIQVFDLRHRDLARSYTYRKSVAPMRNRILVYPDSDEDDEEYCSLPPLLSCFQTPQPCATFNSMHHNSNEEVDIDNITLEEYARYEVAMSRVKSLRKTEHEVPHRCDDKTMDIIDYEDSDHKDGELSDLPIFSATNKFASVCEQVDENIDISIAEEKEEVPMKDDEIDNDVDHSNTNEALQWSFAKDPFLVCIKLNEQSSFVLHTIPLSISNELLSLTLDFNWRDEHPVDHFIRVESSQ
ncbi:hypothetical protein Tco_1010675 [Tanacetum coccineum]